MTDENKKVNLTIDPKVLSTSEIAKLVSQLEKLDKLTTRINKKGINNNFTISAKDNANLRGVAGNVLNSANRTSSQLQNAQDMHDAITSGGMKGTSDDVSALNNSIKALTKALEVAKRAGYNSETGTINPGKKFYDTLGFKVNANNKNFSTPTGQDAKDFSSFNRELKTTLRNLGSQVNNTRYNSNKLSNNVGTTLNYGRISAERLQQYRSAFDMGGDKVQALRSTISNNQNRINIRRSDLSSQISEINKKEASGVFDAQEASSENARKIALQKQLEELTKANEKLKDFTQTINDADKSFSTSKSSLNTGVSSGNTSVSAAKDSVAGMLNSRKVSIATGIVSSGVAASSSLLASGSSNRTSAYNNGVGSIMLSEANNNGVTRSSDNKILNTLSNLGLSNGTNYNSSQMTSFANAYTSSTGDSSKYKSAANQYSQLSRYTGMGTSTTTSLESAAGTSGVTDTSFARTVAGSITNSGMTAKSSAQGSALTSVLSNTGSTGISNSQAKRTAAFEGVMANYGSTTQGSNFSSSYSSLTSALGNFNDPTARYLWGGNSGKYSGANGQAKLLEAMQSSDTDPSSLKTPIKNVLKAYGGNTETAAAQLSWMTGQKVSVKQAKKYIRAYKAGKLDKSYLNKQAKKDTSTGSGNGKSSYSSSGTSTIQNKSSQRSQAGNYLSEAGDTIRSAGNGLTKALGPLGTGISLMAGATAFNAAKHVAGVGLSVGGGLLGGVGSKALSALGKTRLGQKVAGSVLGKGVAKFGSKISDLLGTSGKHFATTAAKDTEEAASSASKSGIFSKIASGIKSKGGSLLSSVSKDGSVLEKVGSVGSKLGKASGVLSVGLAGLDVVNAVHSTKAGTTTRHKKVGSAVGSGVGGALGGLAGSALGPLGSIAGAYVGSKVGSWVGGKVGGLWKGKNSSSSSSKDTKSDKNSNYRKRVKVNKDQKNLLKQFNSMLDKAEKVIAEAKSITSSSSSDSGSDDNSSKSSGSDWEDEIKAAAKKAGVSLSSTQLSEIEKLIQAESGGNESVPGINDGDGTGAAEGLLQYKKSTFNKYKTSSNANIDSGTDQLAAFFNNSNWASDLSTWVKNYSSGKTGWGPTGSATTNAHGGMFNYTKHATGGIFDTATTIGDNIVGEAGREAAIPMNSANGLVGESMLSQVANSMGKMVVTPNELTSNSSGTSVSLSPTNNINVTANTKSDASAIADAVSAQLKQSTSQQNAALRSYYANVK